jgi:hypothetical protein
MRNTMAMCLMFLSLITASYIQAQAPANFHNSTNWSFNPSLKYDALCMINILTGDPFYVQYYEKEYEEFSKQITPEVKPVLDKLLQIKQSTGVVLSAGLCLYYSAVADSTLDQLIQTTQDLSVLKNNFSKTVYFNEAEWGLFESLQGDLRACFVFLKEVGFEKYWSENNLPKIENKIEDLQEMISANNYNLISVQEKLLGFPLQNNAIMVNMIYYAQPHGMKITGTEFITDIAYDFNTVVHNAAHEMLHPPYDLAANNALQQSLEVLKNDTFLMNKVLNHDPKFGYNTFEAYIEENCVRALDQVVSEEIGLSDGPGDRWKNADGGMHVFANALYQVMKEENFNSHGELFSDFLIRSISEGKFDQGSIKKRFDSVEP